MKNIFSNTAILLLICFSFQAFGQPKVSAKEPDSEINDIRFDDRYANSLTKNFIMVGDLEALERDFFYYRASENEKVYLSIAATDTLIDTIVRTYKGEQTSFSVNSFSWDRTFNLKPPSYRIKGETFVDSYELANGEGIFIVLEDGWGEYEILVTNRNINDSDGDGVIDEDDPFPNDPNDGLPTFLYPPKLSQDDTLELSISWNTVEGAEYYEVFYHPQFGAASVASSYDKTVQTTSTTTNVGAEGYFAVRACNKNTCSDLSDRVEVRESKPPSPPNNGVKASEANSSSIEISWSYTTKNVAKSYEIYICNNENSNTCSLLGSTEENKYIASGLSSGNTYYFRVKACNVAGCSTYSEYASSSIKSNLSPVSGFSISYGNQPGMIELSWDEMDYANSYKLYSCTSYAIDSCSVVLNDIKNTSYKFEGLQSGAYYLMRVTACKDLECSELSEVLRGLVSYDAGTAFATDFEKGFNLFETGGSWSQNASESHHRLQFIGRGFNLISTNPININNVGNFYFETEVWNDSTTINNFFTFYLCLNDASGYEIFFPIENQGLLGKNNKYIEIDRLQPEDDGTVSRSLVAKSKEISIPSPSLVKVSKTGSKLNVIVDGENILSLDLDCQGNLAIGASDEYSLHLHNLVIETTKLSDVKPAVTLSTPNNISASDSLFEDKINLSWRPVSNAAFYEVQRCSESAESTCVNLDNNISNTSISITSGEKGKVYQFRVRACANNSCSSWSRYEAGSKSIPSVPAAPQQSLSGIIRSNGKASEAAISIGASSDGGDTSKISFTTDENVNIVTKIYPQDEDVGKKGDIFVVLRVTTDGKKDFYSLNPDGLWLAWNASLKFLEPTKSVDSLSSEETVEVYSGTMSQGSKYFYIGYSVIDDANGKPIIHVNGKPFKINVGNKGI
jgi:hypothetical protein